MSVGHEAETLPRNKVRKDYVPAEDYSPSFHALEMERMWPRVWQNACREEEIPHVGDYVNYEIGDESILIVRNAPGSIRAFYNVCSHRGRRLRDDERGNMKSIYCNYHAWSFDLEGKPAVILDRDDWQGCPNFSDDDLSLSPVRVDTWAGWVWINMDPDCEPLGAFLAPLPERFNAYEWEHCRIRSYQTIIFPVNWKVAMEAFVEAYHVTGTHPQLLRWGHGPAPALEEFYEPGMKHGAHTGARHYEFRDDAEFKDAREYLYTNVSNTYHQLRGLYHEDGLRAAERLRDKGPEGMSLAEARTLLMQYRKEEMIKSGARYPEQLKPEHQRATEIQIFPNASFLPSVEGAFCYRARPNGNDPDSTIFDIWSLGRYAPGKEPPFKHEYYPSPEAFKGQNGILEQDFGNMLAVHKGMKSRSWKSARPNPREERNVFNIHRVLHHYIYGEEI